MSPRLRSAGRGTHIIGRKRTCEPSAWFGTSDRSRPLKNARAVGVLAEVAGAASGSPARGESIIQLRRVDPLAVTANFGVGDSKMGSGDPRWNLNIHYHRVFLNAAPSDATSALDVGCGDGLLTFDLAERGLDVIGVDPHAESIERARSDSRATGRTDFVCGDVFTSDLHPGSFDLVAASAVLHHIDARAGLLRMKQLVRPGGVLAIVGFGQPDCLQDRLLEFAGAATKRARLLRREYWEHNAPISWPPPLTTGEMRDLGRDELPGATFHRLMSNRFSLVWEAPGVESTNGSLT